jgi:SAM-dependent methyltransferase
MKSQDLYDLHSAALGPADTSPTAPSQRNVQMAAWLRRQLTRKMSTPGLLFELGFGDGELSRLLARELSGTKVVGCDIAAGRVERANQLASALGLAERLEYRVLDFDMDLDKVADGSAQAVVTIDVLEHVFDVFGFIANIARILRPGGLLLLRVPNVAYVKHRLTLARGQLPVTSSWFGPPNDLAAWRATWGWDGGHLHFFTQATLAELLRGAGLTPLDWGDPGARFESLRRYVPGLLCGNLCVLAERTGQP